MTGLNVNDVTFAVSPPFFDFNSSRPADKTEENVYSLLRDNMVCGQTIPASVHCIFYYCFASICFHLDFLSRVLHQKNKLQASHFLNHIPSYIKDEATVKYPWIKTETTPTFTGLPPHITNLAKFKQLKIEMVSYRDIILKGVARRSWTRGA